MRMAVAVAVLALGPSLAMAQYQTRAGVAPQTSSDKQQASLPPRYEFAVRYWSGVGGAFAGIIAGLGFSFLAPTDGEFDFLGNALLGGIVGSAAFAAMPKRGAKCPYAGRMLAAVPFAIVTGVVGIVAGGGNEGILVTFPLGTALGAATGASIC